MSEDPGVAIWIRARSHTLAEIHYEIISTAIPIPSADSRRVVISHLMNPRGKHDPVNGHIIRQNSLTSKLV